MAGDKKVVSLILERMNDSSHLVRRKAVICPYVPLPRFAMSVCPPASELMCFILAEQVETLKRIARIGDSTTVRSLMTFLRNSWEYVKVRGEDTDIKLEVAHLLFHALAFKDNDKIKFLLEALQHPETHIERDRIGVTLFSTMKLLLPRALAI
jgi:hypothetical protein